ncbi:MAG: hypothetical protein GXO39_00015 [Thermotogae bacterium]|nr:hypothetical protein [Thermotogota bacterium]
MLLLVFSQYDWEADEYYYEEIRRKGKYVLAAAGYGIFLSGDKPQAAFGYLGIRTTRLEDPRAYFTFLGGGGYSFTHDLFYGQGGVLYERRTQRFGGRVAFHLGVGILASYYSWGTGSSPLADSGVSNTEAIMFDFPIRAAVSLRFGAFEFVPELQAVPSVSTNFHKFFALRGVLYVMYGHESESEFFEAKRKKKEMRYKKLK